MGILFNKLVLPYLNKGLPAQPLNNNPDSNIKFGTTIPADKFESNNPQRYTSEFMIRKLAENNPKIKQILSRVNIPLEFNIDGLNQVQAHHAEETRKIAEGIINNLPASLKMKTDSKAIIEAAYLHDIGKVFIPDEILNKNTKLTEEETLIMHQHSELGYELLKNSSLDPKVLNLIKNHHQNARKNGYPKVDSHFFADINLQILSMADKYSALTEQRAYKPALTRKEALTIIRNDVREGKLNPLIFNALVTYTDEIALKNNVNV